MAEDNAPTEQPAHPSSEGAAATSAAVVAAAGGVVDHVYVDGLFTPTITVDVVDEDGTHIAAGTKDITVNDVEPTVLLSGDDSLDEGETYRSDFDDLEFLSRRGLAQIATGSQADAILHWLAEMFPNHKLGGAGTPDTNYELNNWMAFLTGDFHPAFFPFFNTQRYTAEVDEDALAAVKEAAEARVGSYVDFFEAHMENRDFIVGETRSIADAYAVPMLRWVRLLNKKLDQYPALDAYLARMQDDPAVEAALAEQGLKK